MLVFSNRLLLIFICMLLALYPIFAMAQTGSQTANDGVNVQAGSTTVGRFETDVRTPETMAKTEATLQAERERNAKAEEKRVQVQAQGQGNTPVMPNASGGEAIANSNTGAGNIAVTNDASVRTEDKMNSMATETTRAPATETLGSVASETLGSNHGVGNSVRSNSDTNQNAGN